MVRAPIRFNSRKPLSATPRIWTIEIDINMHVLVNEDDWQGSWISADIEMTSPLLGREFKLEKPIRRARAVVCGPGWCELYINGKKVGDSVLDPGPTNYYPRCLYVAQDVTEQLASTNTIGVFLGGGWYLGGNVEWLQGGAGTEYGDRPELLMQLNIEFTDGTSTSIYTDNQ